MPPLTFIFFTVLIDMLGYGMILPLLPFYVQEQQGGAAIVGGLSAFYAALQLLSGPTLGALSDRYGRKPVLLLCLLGTGVAYTLFGLANSLPWLFLATLLDGLTGNNLSTAYAYVADITTPQERSRGMGIVGAGFGVGLMVGPALGGVLTPYGLHAPAFAAAALALLNTLYGFFFLPESLPPERRTQHRASYSGLGQLGQLLRLPALRHDLLIIFLLNLAFSGLQTNFPLFSAARFGWDARANGLFFGFLGVIGVLTQGVLYLRLQPRFGEKKLLSFGLLFLSLGLMGMSLAPQGWMLLPVVGMAVFASSLATPSISGLVSLHAPQNAQGALMGGQQILFSLAAIFGPLLAGLSFEHLSPVAPYALGSLLTLLAWGAAKRGSQG